MAEIRIIGTAHVSQQSVDEVRTAIEEFKPDVVAIELDTARYTAVKK
jgi:pheromone shutdown protein TraB